VLLLCLLLLPPSAEYNADNDNDDDSSIFSLNGLSFVSAQGWYPAPSYAARRDASGMTPRAHAVTIIDQCRTPAAPKYYIWSA
jgi:hypothetical protein